MSNGPLTTRIDLLALRRRLWNDEARTPREERSRRAGWIASASVAEVAYLSGRGFTPWPNTARACGLL